jgi:hypothetical protein
VILLPRHGRTSQPQQPIQPAWGEFGGCTAVWCAAFSQIMQLREGQIARVNSLGAKPGASAGGAHLEYSVTADAGEYFASARAFYSDTAFGALYVGAPVASSTIGMPLSQRPRAASNPQMDICVNSKIGFTATSGSLALTGRNSSSVTLGISAANQFDGARHAWFLRLSSVAAENGIWRDGVRQALSGSIACSGTVISDTQVSRVGNITDAASTSYVAVDPIYLVAAWSSYISDSDAADLSRNPWKLFPSPSRRMMALSAAAAFPTLSAAGMTGITTTGGRPTVSYTF